VLLYENNISRHLSINLAVVSFLINLCTNPLKINKAELALCILTCYQSYVSKWSSPLSKTVTKRNRLVLMYLWRKRTNALCGTEMTQFFLCSNFKLF